MINFYDLIDTYATMNDIDQSEVLHMWYRGAIDAGDLLKAWLENEGIYGYTDYLIAVIKTLNTATKEDNLYNPWKAE